MSNNTLNVLPQAILQTVTYSDIFDYPLSVREIHHYLIGRKASIEEVMWGLASNQALMQVGNYYLLPGREKIVELRTQRESRSKQLMPVALHYGRILGRLPFIRMVALTGSLAVLNVSGDEDFDYMLITASGRLWTARAFALLFNRIVKLFGHTICPNLILSENALEWSNHDLYSAREFCQMIPITGLDAYQRLINANRWAKDFLPNGFEESGILQRPQKFGSAFQNVLEFLLRGKLGDHFERWEMNRKIARFFKQEGFGEETIFNADICQGNFDHHRKWTQEAFQDRLSKAGGEARIMKGESSGVKA